jgi:GNAT superfamily N-acetyltransferase
VRIPVLDLCFTAPSYQGKGAGGQLVQWGVDRADEMGLPTFVEASPPGVRLYNSRGFETAERVVLWDERWKDKDKMTYDFMFREKRNLSK